MKTKMNLSNLKKLVLTACFAVAMITGTYTQPNGGFAKANLMVLSSLEALMVSVEQSVRYVAPAELENYDVSAEMERLEALAAASEESLKYVAPLAEEAAENALEMERLEMLADATEASLKYVAPAAEETETVSGEMERLDILAAATEASLQYRAPEVFENSNFEILPVNKAEIIFANNN
jgi:hypothetical protein